jgi:hypothetical protein
LGARHIAYCEVSEGKVVDRVAVRSLEELSSRLGPGMAPARVAFEAAREAWHVHDTLKSWGHEPKIVDTTRLKTIGVGQHKRKNDALDAENIAMAVDQGRIPEAHVLSPARRELRKRLSIRQALVETRSQYIVTFAAWREVRGLCCHRVQAITSSIDLRRRQPSTVRARGGPSWHKPRQAESLLMPLPIGPRQSPASKAMTS